MQSLGFLSTGACIQYQCGRLKGTYSEWYKYWLDRKTLLGNGDFTGTEVYDYHKKMYGEDFTYADFAPMFKAMSYDANEWADSF